MPTPAIYPIYLCKRRIETRMDGTQYWNLYAQDVVAFAPSRSMAEAQAHTLNVQHEKHEHEHHVYFTVGAARHGIVSLPKAIKLVG